MEKDLSLIQPRSIDPNFYEKTVTLTSKEFAKEMSVFNKSKATKSSKSDLKKIEKLLSVREDTLAGTTFYVTKIVCKCGRTLTPYDVIFTALESGHPAPFILQMMLGSKYIVQRREGYFKCSDCGIVTNGHGMHYQFGGYGCCIGQPK